MEDFEYEEDLTEITSERRSKMLNDLKQYPFEVRRRELQWKQVLDKDKKVLDNPIKYPIYRIDTEQLRKILLDSDYDNNFNYDIMMQTVWDEYHFRKNNKLD